MPHNNKLQIQPAFKKLQFLLFFLLIGFAAPCQDFRSAFFKPNKIDTVKQKLDSILILGVGQATSRIFLDNLTEQVIDNFKSLNVTATYVYLGKNAATAKREFRLLTTKGYKAFLLFLPKDSAFFEVQMPKEYLIPLARAGRVINPNSNPRKTFAYQGNFDLQLFLNEPKPKLIWTAYLDIDTELHKTSVYKNVAEKILYSFRDSKYIR